MTARNDCQSNEDFDAFRRLDDLILRQTNPDVWNRTTRAEGVPLVEQWRASRDPKDRDAEIKALAALYRFCCRKASWVTREVFFREMAFRLQLAALDDQDARVKPLNDRMTAIWEKYGWPVEDEGGDLWFPEDHGVNPLPPDYVACSGEWHRAWDESEKATFRAACVKYGVEEIADLKENDPEGYERRLDRGAAVLDAQGGKDDEDDELPAPGITEVREK